MDVIIPIINIICLIGVIVGLRWWQKKHSILSEKKMALIFSGYGSFWILTTFTLIYFETNHSSIAIFLGFLFLLLDWSLGYLFGRWLYRQNNPPK